MLVGSEHFLPLQGQLPQLSSQPLPFTKHGRRPSDFTVETKSKWSFQGDLRPNGSPGLLTLLSKQPVTSSHQLTVAESEAPGLEITILLRPGQEPLSSEFASTSQFY